MAEYTRPSDYPQREPLLTHLLIEDIHRRNVEAGTRPKAYDTTFRASDAGHCARAMAYDALGYERTDPPDPAGEWVMWLGSLIGEWVGEAIGGRSEVQVRHGDLVSGHVDAVADHPKHGLICFELKTKGSYGFNKAIGLNRRAYKQEHPEGPGLARLQGALYATALGADLLVIGVIAMEAVSKQLAAKVGFSDLDRIMAEWHYTPAEFGPWAERELARMYQLKDDYLAYGNLPPRTALGDDFEEVKLDPTAAYLDWRCMYCPFFTQCRNDALEER